jgi:hypothetical protein
VGVIIKAARGFVDRQWWKVLMAYHHSVMTLDDHIYAQLLRQDTGYSLQELDMIEGAFEGQPFVPGNRRVSSGKELTVEQRLRNVLDVLLMLEQWDEKTEDLISHYNLNLDR